MNVESRPFPTINKNFIDTISLFVGVEFVLIHFIVSFDPGYRLCSAVSETEKESKFTREKPREKCSKNIEYFGAWEKWKDNKRIMHPVSVEMEWRCGRPHLHEASACENRVGVS